MYSRFSDVTAAPVVDVYALNKMYGDDYHPDKVNLGASAYRNEIGRPWVLPVVQKAEINLASDETLKKEYLPSLGLPSFSDLTVKLLLGTNCPAVIDNRCINIQTLSATGGLRIGAEFIFRNLGYKTLYLPNRCCDNIEIIFEHAGYTDTHAYRYWNPDARGLDFKGLLEDLGNAPENSIVFFHTSAHNPTGVDLSNDQWDKLPEIFIEGKLFPFFCSEAQGFATGDIDKDVYAVRLFVSKGIELFCAQSFAKNFGLYNERVGSLLIVSNDAYSLNYVKSNFSSIVSAMYGNPPGQGSRIISYILNCPQIFQSWKAELRTMAQHIINMRKSLRGALESLGTPGDWSHLTTQRGMFSFSALTENQVSHMIECYHIYMPPTGRINVCGITPLNVEYIAQAIYDTVTNIK